MFADFEKAFFKKNETDKKIPQEILNLISENLPDGFQYSNIGSGAAAVQNGNKVMNVKGFKAKLLKDFPKNFKPTNMKELTEFMYRTQQRVELVPIEENKITLDGTSFRTDEIIKFPLDPDKEISEQKWYMEPASFQPPLKLPLETKNVAKYITIQRKPYADMKKSLFESIGSEGFKISYLLDEELGSVKFNFDVSLEKAESTKEIVEILELYLACMEGNLTFAGTHLPKTSVPEVEKDTVRESLDFWGKVYKLEQEFETDFKPDRDLEDDELILIEQLYRSLVGKKPFKEYINIENMKIDVADDFDVNSLINQDDLSVQFIQDSRIKLMGREVEFYTLITYFDFKVIDYRWLNKNKKKYKLFTSPVAGKKIYQSSIHFKTREEAEKYQEFEKLQNATEVTLN